MTIQLRLAAFAEALGEAFGQVGAQDAHLREAHVVVDAVEGDLVRVFVVDGECGAGVAVAGLAYGAGIEEVTAVWLDGDGAGQRHREAGRQSARDGQD